MLIALIVCPLSLTCGFGITAVRLRANNAVATRKIKLFRNNLKLFQSFISHVTH